MNIETIYDKQVNSYHQYHKDFSFHAFNSSIHFLCDKHSVNFSNQVAKDN